MWAVVPAKDPADAKQRLSFVLNNEQRRKLFRAMLEDVVEVLLKVPALDGLMLVSRNTDAEWLAEQYGVRLLHEKENKGHTAAVSFAARVLGAEGATGILQLPGDVPMVSVDEIEQVMAAHGAAPAVTIVPSRDKKGSNCVLCSPPEVMPLTFGENSFYPHLTVARNHGLEPRVLEMPGIGLDIDTADDLRKLLALNADNRTGRFLRENSLRL
ncbi:MAG: 2-phospho-L-lactate guanylyltransferase [SAR324 cluster bacterium]|nr:2-phospho-L-lactate guanylyltransferase [SAR324 cluster bacterium]